MLAQLFHSVSTTLSTIDPLASRVLITSLHIAFLLLAAFLLRRLMSGLIARFDRALRGFTESSERLKRARTLSYTLQTTATVVLFSVTALLILSELGLDLAPLLTAAGIGGLAIGFGAQNLVRDVISGFFILLEDQIRVGDAVKVGDKSGQVESIGLRILTLRDFDGSVHMIPNGTITTITNMTKDFSYSTLTLAVGAQEDVEKVIRVLREVGATLRQEPTISQDLLADLEIVGLDDISGTRFTVTVRCKTAPGMQWRVTRELRRQVKAAFAAHQIELASVA
jgi:moderate conductance mechanosensitive channel